MGWPRLCYALGMPTKRRASRKPKAEQPEFKWADMLETVLTMPGGFSKTYTRFYNYSVGNQILFYMQGCMEPVATYDRWQKMGRQVIKGSKAKYVMRPKIIKDPEDQTKTKFIGVHFQKAIFGLSETEGEELPEFEHPEWSLGRARNALEITEVPFAMADGNCQGYSFERSYAINPVAAYPFKTTMHELAHIVLGHTSGDGSYGHRGIGEFQAESVAYILMNELNLTEVCDLSESRAYVQHWLKGETPEDSKIRQVFTAANTILEAGFEKQED